MIKQSAPKAVFYILLMLTLLLAGCDNIGHSFNKIKVRDSAANASDLPARTLTTEKHAVEIVTLLSDLNLPWGMAFLPDASLLITEKSGNLYRYHMNQGSIHAVSGLPETRVWGQGGLMDILPHPDFQHNRWLYFSYTGLMENGRAATRVARARLLENRLEDLEILFTAKPSVKSGAHFGSALMFDGEGFLYITSGERHARPLVQDLSTHLGKIIRLRDDGRIPDDNPFLGRQNALPEIYSYGHRNPQGIAVDPRSKAIWSVEHGPRGGDEVNIIQAGKNYGWPVITYGREYAGGKIGEGTRKPGMEQPVYHYVPSIAPSNMIFYRGQAFPHWRGNLLIGALALTHINRLELDGGKIIHEERLLDDMNIPIKSIEEGPDGLIYILSRDGELMQLRPVSESP